LDEKHRNLSVLDSVLKSLTDVRSEKDFLDPMSDDDQSDEIGRGECF
jgi:hypothetical protein